MDARTIALGVIATTLAGCATGGTQTQAQKQAFNQDVAFLQKHTDVVILTDKSGQGRVAVLPKMQGRVMTSSAAGPNGYSFGWINRELVAAGKPVPHMNAYGGEDRFWLGPEGGQFSIFFGKGVPFDMDHWYTPAPVDTEPWELVVQDRPVRLVAQDDPGEELLRHGVRSACEPGGSRPGAGGRPEAAGRDGRPGRQDGGLRIGQPHRQHRQGALDQGDRPAVDLDSRHVQPVARDHDCGPVRGRDRKTSLARSPTTRTSVRCRPSAW